MPTYYVNEALFALPDRSFVDRTIHRLEASLSDDAPLSVTIRRVPMDEGKSLRELVDGEIAASMANAKSFTVIEQAEVEVGGAPAILLCARWRAGDIAHYQRQVHIAFDWTWIALAVTGPYASRAACDETFDRIVRSLEWRSS